MPISDLHEHVNRFVQLLGVAHRRLVPAAEVPALGGTLSTPVLTREQAAGQWAPDEDPALLVQCEGHKLVLGVSCLQGIVDLLAHVALQAEALGNPKSLHKLPAGMVGAAHVAYLA